MTRRFAADLLPAASHVLETMFFTSIMGTADAADDLEDPICKTVEFQGIPDGELCLALSMETAAALASSFLGLDPETVTVAECEQITGELANMICGSALSRFAPAGAFELTVVPGPDFPTEWDSCVGVQLPEGSLALYARMDRL